MKTVSVFLNTKQATQAITLIGKRITKLKVVGMAFVGAAGILIGAAINNFEDAGQLEATNEENKRKLAEAIKREEIKQSTEETD